MPDKKVISVRFYPKVDADLIAWLENLVTGEGNTSIKVMLRAGIVASLRAPSTDSISSPARAPLEPANLQAALESFLPRIREIVDASLASASLARVGRDPTVQDDDVAAAQLLNGHLIGDED